MSEADAQAPAEIEPPVRVPLSRREFLNYLWGVSLAVFMAGSGGATIWLLIPNFREGEFGGVIPVLEEDIPDPDTGPKEFPKGRFWLVNLGQKDVSDDRQPADYPLQEGVRAIYKVCTHLGCLYKWVPTSDQFECPCHGSKFLLTGARIDGPARRNLDVFPISAVDEAGNELARTEPSMGSQEGTPIQIPPGTVELRIDTGRRIVGARSSKDGGGL